MEIPAGTGVLHWIRIPLSLALLLLIAGLAGAAAGQPVLGYILLGVAGISWCTGCGSLLILRRRLRSDVRGLQARQRLELDDAFRGRSR